MGKKLPDDLTTLKVTELKEALKERSLTQSGNKAELVARLQDFLTKQKNQESGSESSGSTPKKQAPAEAEAQNGAKDEENVKEGEKEKEKEEKEKALQKEKEEKEKAQREKEEKERKEKEEKDRKEKEQKEKEQKEKAQKEKEQKEKEQKEKEQKEKELKAKELKEKEQKEREHAEKDKETSKTEEAKDGEKEEEGKKRKTTDDTESNTSNRTLTKHSTSTPSSTTKRPRTWNNTPQSINISTDILKEMLPTPSDDAEMTEDTSADDSRAGRPAQQVYSAPSRREKKDEDPSGPREVPASKKPASATLFIDRFVRPFTLPQVKQLLSQTGELDYFWMNQVKSQAYATFKTVEQATATRDAIFDLMWPAGNGSKLRAEFATEDEAKRAAEQHDLKRSSSTTPATTPASAPFGKDSRGVSREELRDSKNLSRDSRDTRDSRRPPPPPKKSLDDLFKKTVALPSIYWLGLTAEQIAAKKSTSNNDR